MHSNIHSIVSSFISALCGGFAAMILLIQLAQVKFIHSEKATKFCEIFPLLLTVCTVVERKGKISQNFVAFSEYTYEL